MRHGYKRMFPLASTLVWTTSLLNQYCPLLAAPPAGDDVPLITVRVHGFPGLSPRLLTAAEAEAARLLRGVPVEVNWLNCLLSDACSEPDAPGNLTVRVLPKALPGSAVSAVGMAAWSGNRGGVFIFYDRALALRTHSRMLQHILGRVMAHELVHLLFAPGSHSDLGLMRGQWSSDDLGPGSLACSSLSTRSMRSLRFQALRVPGEVWPPE